MMGRPERVLLGHGAGGLLTRQLVRELFRSALDNDYLAREEDSAFVNVESTALAVTTDAFVVDPLFFAGGDIGKLAVCGTVNDLLVAGARPRALTAAFILEEGLPLQDLQRIVASMAAAAAEAAVPIVAGDTKVVPRGKADGCFITTAGVGVRFSGVELGADRARPGDKLLLSGPVGDHGAAIMAARAGIELQTPIRSDCAPLNQLLVPVLERPGGLRAMRDPTRGGLATVLCEIAESSGVGMLVEEQSIPVAPAVRAACELLGLDPLYLACEGRAVLIVAADAADRVLATLRGSAAGEQAACIGEVTAGEPRVVARTAIGGHRLITMLSADPLPRIC
jgi:hydrogenase expression/formation protein HypE